MAIIDEEEPIARGKPAKPKDLSLMSIDELTEYISALEAEIVRVRQDIAGKQQQRSGAEALFKR